MSFTVFFDASEDIITGQWFCGESRGGGTRKSAGISVLVIQLGYEVVDVLRVNYSFVFPGLQDLMMAQLRLSEKAEKSMG